MLLIKRNGLGLTEKLSGTQMRQIKRRHGNPVESSFIGTLQIHLLQMVSNILAFQVYQFKSSLDHAA
jgi:hypothetical protein